VAVGHGAVPRGGAGVVKLPDGGTTMAGGSLFGIMISCASR